MNLQKINCANEQGGWGWIDSSISDSKPLSSIEPHPQAIVIWYFLSLILFALFAISPQGALFQRGEGEGGTAEKQ